MTNQDSKSLNPIVSEKRGVTLLLVLVILSALLSTSIGIFNLVFGELQISGEIADSFVAFYSADQGIEKILYRDRILQEICPTLGENCFIISTPAPVESEGCYTLRVSKTAALTTLVVSGQYRCGTNPTRVVKRGFQVSY